MTVRLLFVKIYNVYTPVADVTDIAARFAPMISRLKAVVAVTIEFHFRIHPFQPRNCLILQF